MKFKKLLLILAIFIVSVSCGDDDPNNPITPVVDPPVIKSIAPPMDYAGSPFTINGDYFGDSQKVYQGKVLIDGAEFSNIHSWKNKEIIIIGNLDTGKHTVQIQTNDTMFSNIDSIKIISDTAEIPFSIAQLNVNTVHTGDVIGIAGYQFGAEQNTSFVTIGDKVITNVELWSDNFINVKMPEFNASGDYDVSVTVNGIQSNKIPIAYKFVPVISVTSYSPKKAKIGDTITINGNYFGDTKEASKITIGSIAATKYPTWSNTMVKFIVPENTVSDTIYMHIGNTPSSLVDVKVGYFTLEETVVEGDPEIYSLDKEEYQVGGYMLIKGKYFGATRGTVTIAPDITLSTQAQIPQWNDTTIRIKIPETARPGALYITTNKNVKSNAVLYSIYVEDKYPMVLIKKGTFTMGNNSSTTQEAPEHQVTISYDFYMSETEITQKQYTTVTTEVPFVQQKGDNLSANFVRFADAINYCNLLSDKAGLDRCYTINGSTITCDFSKYGYRLPTEAEWEYAAKAGTGLEYGFADAPNLHAWYDANSGTGCVDPKNVKGKMPNAWGLYDMNGNVWEWCWDNYSDTYYQECAGGVTDPRGSNAVSGGRVIRGGSFYVGIEKCKATTRESYNSAQNNFDLGFRVVRRR